MWPLLLQSSLVFFPHGNFCFHFSPQGLNSTHPATQCLPRIVGEENTKQERTKKATGAPGSSSKRLKKRHGCARLLLKTPTTHKTQRVEHTTDGKGRGGEVAERERKEGGNDCSCD